MYCLYLVSLAIASLCYARPAQNDLFQPVSGILNNPFLGFPEQYLPLEITNSEYVHYPWIGFDNSLVHTF